MGFNLGFKGLIDKQFAHLDTFCFKLLSVKTDIERIWCSIFVNCNWVDTWWQEYSTHTHKQYIERHNNKNNTINSLIGKSAGRAPSLRVIPWHLPYNWGKSTEKPQSG